MNLVVTLVVVPLVLLYICSHAQFYTLSSPMVCTPCRKKREKYVRAWLRAALTLR